MNHPLHRVVHFLHVILEMVHHAKLFKIDSLLHQRFALPYEEVEYFIIEECLEVLGSGRSLRTIDPQASSLHTS
jgi:hypothetical protein